VKAPAVSQRRMLASNQQPRNVVVPGYYDVYVLLAYVTRARMAA